MRTDDDLEEEDISCLGCSGCGNVYLLVTLDGRFICDDCHSEVGWIANEGKTIQ